MNTTRKTLLSAYQSQRGQSILISKVIVVFAMACLGYGYAQFLERFNLQAGYLALFCSLIAIEAILTHQRAAEIEGREKWVFRLAEILTLAILLKAFILLRLGPANAWAEIQHWQEDILTFLQNGEFMASILILAICWTATNLTIEDIETLHDREQDDSWDELGKVQNALYPIRHRIASTMLTLGGLVLFFAVGARLNVREYVPFLQGKFNPDVPILNVVIYFILVLVLLSQSQLALLRTRWLWDKVSVAPELTRRWILYGLLFFIILAGISLILPTGYSMGILETFLFGFNLIARVFQLLFALILLPFALCAQLFKTTSPDPPASQPAPLAPIPTPVPNPGAPPLWQFIQSLLFWLLLAGIVIFALSQYLRANQALFSRLTQFPLSRWLSRAWRTVWAWISQSTQAAGEFAVHNLRRLIQTPTTAQKLSRQVRNPGGMTAREQVIQIYLALLETGREAGVSRGEGETPYQYSQNLIATHPDITPDVMDLTDDFVNARYSQHEISQDELPRARSAWDRILAHFHRDSGS